MTNHGSQDLNIFTSSSTFDNSRFHKDRVQGGESCQKLGFVNSELIRKTNLWRYECAHSCISTSIGIQAVNLILIVDGVHKKEPLKMVIVIL